MGRRPLESGKRDKTEPDSVGLIQDAHAGYLTAIILALRAENDLSASKSSIAGIT
jgi:hypothetical protein